jgi:SNF2 family DNA or RNA helicase
MGGEEAITPVNAAVLAGQLCQYANGFIYDSDDKEVTHEVHNSKLDALADIVEHAQSPILLFIHFKADKRRILERFEDAVFLDGPKEIEQWNQRKLTLALAHPASAGHGLNLQNGGNTIVWYGMPWSLEQYLQANGRLYRQGQKETVVVHHLIAEGTIDQRIANVIKDKDFTQQKLLDAVKGKL